MLAGAGMKKFGMDLEKEQEVLLAISDVLIEIYMAESAILRTEKNCKRFGEGFSDWSNSNESTISLKQMN